MTIEYRQLPGSKFRYENLMQTSAVFLGDDHLLLVRKQLGIVERYKRFNFRDIQALTYRKTWWRELASSVCLLCALLMAFIALLIHNADGGEGFTIFFGLMALAFAIATVVNWVRGPTVETWLQTAVQRERLASLDREAKVEGALKELSPLILRAQANLVPVPVAQAAVAPPVEQGAVATPIPSAAAPDVSPPPSYPELAP